VRVQPDDEILTLSFDGTAAIPAVHQIFLIDETAHVAFDLRAHAEISFATKHSNEKRFTLLVGNADFIRKQQAEAGVAPAHYALLQNYPNPFNPVTQILYTVPQDGQVQLGIYDLQGQRVALLVEERQAAGQHSAVWQAQEHSSGVYFVKLEVGGLVWVRKAVLMK
jgi:hypothetical protein